MARSNPYYESEIRYDQQSIDQYLGEMICCFYRGFCKTVLN